MRSYTDVNLFNCPDANFMHFSRPQSHGHGCDCILFRAGPFQKAGRERGCIHTVVWKNSANWSRICPKFGQYGKVYQKSGLFANVPFYSRVNRKGRSSSGPLSGPVGFLLVHASAFHLLSWLLSPSIFEKTLFSAGVFDF